MPQNRVKSKLEVDIEKLLEGELALQGAAYRLGQLLEQMSQQSNRRVVVTSYPACNSEI